MRVQHFVLTRQGVVFGYEHDAILRAHLKRRADAKACLSAPGLSELMESIAADAETEYDSKSGDAKAAAVAAEEDEAIDDDVPLPALDDLPEIKKLVKQFEGDDETQRKINYYKSYAKRLIETHVHLCPETEPDDAIAKQLGESAAGKTFGNKEQKTHVAITYNPNHAGEASSKPSCRQPPLRQNGDHLRRLAGLVLRTRSNEIHERDLWMLFDGSKEGSVDVARTITRLCLDCGSSQTAEQLAWSCCIHHSNSVARTCFGLLAGCAFHGVDFGAQSATQHAPQADTPCRRLQTLVSMA